MNFKRRWVGMAVFALMLLAVSPVSAQNDFPDSIFLQVFNCPPGMTAETLVVDECALATGGFDVRIISMEGIAEPLMLADATADVSPDGSNYFVFGDELVNQRGLTGSLRIEETALPAGYTDYVVLGASPAPDGSGYDFENPANADAPDPLLSIYNFAPADTAVVEPTRPVVEVDIDEDGTGTIAFDLDGDGTIEFTITVGGGDALDG